MSYEHIKTPVEYFDAVFDAIGDEKVLKLQWPLSDNTRKLLDEAKETELYYAYKASAHFQGTLFKAIIVPTRLGHVIAYDNYNPAREREVYGLCHNTLIPFVCLNKAMTISDIALVAHVGTPQGQNIGQLLDELINAFSRTQPGNN